MGELYDFDQFGDPVFRDEDGYFEDYYPSDTDKQEQDTNK